MSAGTIDRQRIVRGGWSLIAATILFGAVFTYLAVTFDYPDVLDGAAGDVLPRLLSLGGTGRTVWLIYGLVPLLLVPTGIGVAAAARRIAPELGRAATWLANLTAMAMMIGLLRWPTLHWSLASSWMTASAEAREPIAQTFATANLYLGNVIGEFAGELLLNAFFLVAAVVIARVSGRRWLFAAGLVASVLGWIAMLRNVTTMVAPIAELNNSVLPLWMLILGIAILRAAPRGDIE